MKCLIQSCVLTISLSATLILTGCNSDNNNQNASLSLNITDAPIDSATEVIVEFTGVELKPASGQTIQFDFESTRQIDLLALQDGTSEALLNNETIAAGDYEWLRLKVNAESQVTDSYITFEDGNMHSLFIPSGSQTGLKLVHGFTVAAGEDANFTIDFDLRKSIKNPTSSRVDYILVPALRIIDNTEVGEISGAVSNATMEQDACIDGAVVYVYPDNDVTPDDLGSATEPLTSANINYEESDNTYQFIAAYISPGDYTLSLTCDAANDDPETDDDINFLQSLNASVQTDTTTEVSFD